MRLDIQSISDNYDQFKLNKFTTKLLNYQGLITYLDANHPDKVILGQSIEGNNICKVKIGKGEKKILIWSQMHGNESTGTRAMFDVFGFLKTEHHLAKTILSKLTIDFIPMLNPDGANRYQRRNAIDIDLNRDAHKQESMEMKLLYKQLKKEPYNVLFNLHDQRTIFNVGDTNLPATLSFLAPSEDVTRKITDKRKETMGIIAYINELLQHIIPGQIARYSDEFYPTATGDNFQKMGYPTVLFEAGHYQNDWERQITRKYNTLAIISALYYIATTNDLTDNYLDYWKIPENNNKFLDVIISNVTIVKMNISTQTTLGIMFVDYINDGVLKQKGVITEIGDLSNYHAHTKHDAKGYNYKSNEKNNPNLGDIATFNLGDMIFVNGHLV